MYEFIERFVVTTIFILKNFKLNKINPLAPLYLFSNSISRDTEGTIKHQTKKPHSRLFNGGEGGIRTPGEVALTQTFQVCTLSRSDTSPCKKYLITKIFQTQPFYFHAPEIPELSSVRRFETHSAKQVFRYLKKRLPVSRKKQKFPRKFSNTEVFMVELTER